MDRSDISIYALNLCTSCKERLEFITPFPGIVLWSVSPQSVTVLSMALLFVLSKPKSQIAEMVSSSPQALCVPWGCQLLTMMYGGWTEIHIAPTPGTERHNYTPLTFKFRIMLPTELLYTCTCIPIH